MTTKSNARAELLAAVAFYESKAQQLRVLGRSIKGIQEEASDAADKLEALAREIRKALGIPATAAVA